MPGKINASDLTAEQRKSLGIRSPKTHDFSKEEVRQRAISLLARIADLKQTERKRILSHALKINEV